MVDVGDETETTGRSFRRGGKRAQSEPWSPRSQLGLEIALVSERLDRLRERHSTQLLDVLRTECAIDTSLMALESYSPRVSVYRAKSRDNLKNKLLELQKERRGLVNRHELEASGLQDRLFKLLRQHEGLGGAAW